MTESIVNVEDIFSGIEKQHSTSVKRKAADVIKKAAPVKKSKDKVYFSDVAGYSPSEAFPDMQDFAVTKFSNTDLTEEQQNDVPEKPLYFQENRTHTVLFSIAMEHNDRVMLSGPPGTGKSQGLVPYYCNIMNRPRFLINFAQGMEADDLLGRQAVVNDGGTSVTQWVDGQIVGYITQPYLIHLDERNRADKNVNHALQRVLEKNGVLKLNGKEGDNIVMPHEQCRWVASDNTKGVGDGIHQYAAQTQDVSNLNRFQLHLEMGYLPAFQEEQLVKLYSPEIATSLAKDIVKFANLIRKGFVKDEISLPLSARNFEAISKYTVIFNNPIQAIKYCFYTHLADESEKSAVAEIARTCFGSSFGEME